MQRISCYTSVGNMRAFQFMVPLLIPRTMGPLIVGADLFVVLGCLHVVLHNYTSAENRSHGSSLTVFFSSSVA